MILFHSPALIPYFLRLLQHIPSRITSEILPLMPVITPWLLPTSLLSVLSLCLCMSCWPQHPTDEPPSPGSVFTHCMLPSLVATSLFLVVLNDKSFGHWGQVSMFSDLASPWPMKKWERKGRDIVACELNDEKDGHLLKLKPTAERDAPWKAMFKSAATSFYCQLLCTLMAPLF